MADFNQSPPSQPLSIINFPVIPDILASNTGDRLDLETGKPDYNHAQSTNVGLTTNVLLPEIAGYTTEFKSGIRIFDLFLAYLTYQCPEPDYPREGQVYPLFDHNKTD